MLRSLKNLERYDVNATDGELGHVSDFLLDDEHWTIRYLVADGRSSSRPPRSASSTSPAGASASR
jgi:hypothetical protein